MALRPVVRGGIAALLITFGLACTGGMPGTDADPVEDGDAIWFVDGEGVDDEGLQEAILDASGDPEAICFAGDAEEAMEALREAFDGSGKLGGATVKGEKVAVKTKLPGGDAKTKTVDYEACEEE